MNRAFIKIKQVMSKDGLFVIVCGDNLIGGLRIPTADILNRLLSSNGFVLFDSFTDCIKSHHIPPSRQGHKGIIKQEIISAFKKADWIGVLIALLTLSTWTSKPKASTSFFTNAV